MASKVNVDQLIEQIGGMTVLELADLVKALEGAFGVSAAMPVAGPAAGAGEATAAVEEKSEFTVTLEDAGANKINVIKELRKLVPNLGLGDAKKMAEETPSEVAVAVSKADATKMKEALEAVGAKVKLA